MRKLILMLCLILNSNSLMANNKLTTTEINELSNINIEFENKYNNANIDNLTKNYNKLKSEVQSIKEKIDDNKYHIADSMELIQRELISGTSNDDLISSLKNASSSIKELNEQLNESESKLEISHRDMEKSKGLLLIIEKIKNQKILELYNRIKTRLINEESILHEQEYSGKIKCGSRETISLCIERNRRSIERSFSLMNGDIDSIKIKSFDFVDASLDMQGVLKYSVNTKYTKLFSKADEKAIRKELGLNKHFLLLTSNDENTEYYVNNEFAGKGKVVEFSGTFSGVIDILAKNGDKKESIKTTSYSKNEYHFKFSTRNDSKVTTSSYSEQEQEQEQEQENKTQEAAHSNDDTSDIGVDLNKFLDPINIIVYEDNKFFYIQPKIYKEIEKIPLQDTIAESMNYCKENFDALLVTADDLNYLDNQKSLPEGQFWTSKEENKPSSEKKQFICKMPKVEVTERFKD
ncbi:hypothetical protein [Vibrio aestuarianus]|uniref:hypothetical protein n=1 Tax=Vibrio aestuarianus TaxID=28171 RepID=UPI00237C60FB|nr:hypothetical protein [Vibrio aestuarianus]MDE1335024.1 hypothetical protein [Vibrio aestuarianus]